MSKINELNNVIESKYKLSDEAERLIVDYIYKQSRYSAILFSSNNSKEMQKQMEIAEIELNKSRLNLRKYISHLETDLNSVITYYEDEPDEEESDEPSCILSDRVDELEKGFDRMFAKVHSIDKRMVDLEKRLNNMFITCTINARDILH